MGTLLSGAQIKAWKPYALPVDGLSPLERTRRRMEDANQWAPWQMIGRRMAIGCVALEITQRCNLDCSYCYLSESSEALKDIPIEEVFRRIDMIHAHYGANTDVQITGGDPTLRQGDELIAIVAYIRQKGMRSSLFTNGVKATREMLERLCAAGLEDVAFHVDMTQERKGYVSEQELNAVREEYIERGMKRLGMIEVGDKLDGAEEPKVSAPSTKNGKRQKSPVAESQPVEAKPVKTRKTSQTKGPLLFPK